jgi:hypothetical protein
VNEIPVPTREAPWPEIWRFALTYNAYDRHGGFDGAARIGNRALRVWEESQRLPQELDRLRCALFFEQRRYRHLEAEPTGQAEAYIRALAQRIYEVTGGSVPGSADAFP